MKLTGRGGITTTLALIALGAGALSGCEAAPAATRSPISETTPPATTSAPATSSPAVLTLDDDGIGGLSLGMSKKAALATGLLKTKTTDAGSPCEVHAGKRGIQLVYLAGGKVSIIAVGPTIRLANGIGVGDTYAELHDADPRQASEGEGRIYLEAPGTKIPAHYRIGLSDGEVFPTSKIEEIALQADDQTCYE
jgi:hypothetical protein